MLFAMNIQYDLAPLSNSALSLSIPLFHPPPPLLIDSDAIRRLTLKFLFCFFTGQLSAAEVC